MPLVSFYNPWKIRKLGVSVIYVSSSYNILWKWDPKCRNESKHFIFSWFTVLTCSSQFSWSQCSHPVLVNAPILYLLKTPKSLCFSGVFFGGEGVGGYKMGTFAKNGLICFYLCLFIKTISIHFNHCNINESLLIKEM